MIKINKLIGDILLRILPNNRMVYNFSKILINRYNNNKNSIPQKNGEFNILNSPARPPFCPPLLQQEIATAGDMTSVHAVLGDWDIIQKNMARDWAKPW